MNKRWKYFWSVLLRGLLTGCCSRRKLPLPRMSPIRKEEPSSSTTPEGEMLVSEAACAHWVGVMGPKRQSSPCKIPQRPKVTQTSSVLSSGCSRPQQLLANSAVLRGPCSRPKMCCSCRNSSCAPRISLEEAEANVRCPSRTWYLLPPLPFFRYRPWLPER